MVKDPFPSPLTRVATPTTQTPIQMILELIIIHSSLNPTSVGAVKTLSWEDLHLFQIYQMVPIMPFSLHTLMEKR